MKRGDFDKIIFHSTQ